MSDHDDDFVWRLVCFALAAIVLAWAFAQSVRYSRDCEARGGHVVTKYVYKDSVSFCIKDGKVLDE